MNLVLLRAVAILGCLLILPLPGIAQQITYTQVDYPGAESTNLFKMNGAGDIVGTAQSDASAGIAFVYHTASNTFESVSKPGADFTWGRGINDGGVIVGEYANADAPFRHGYVYNGSFTSLDFSADVQVKPRGINNAGDIAGIMIQNGTYTGFRYASGTFASFSNGYYTLAHDINNLGLISGTTYDNTFDNARGFVYDGHLYTDVLFPGAANTTAFGINDAGDVVGDWWNADGILHGFLLHNGVYTSIEIPSAIDTEVDRISNDGTLTGYFITDSYSVHGYYARVNVVPEPGSCAMLLAGLSILLFGAAARHPRATRQLSSWVHRNGPA